MLFTANCRDGRIGQRTTNQGLTLVSDAEGCTLEAWVPSLAVYAVAKVRAKTDGALRTVVDPMAAVFATRRGRPAKAATEAAQKEPPAK